LLAHFSRRRVVEQGQVGTTHARSIGAVPGSRIRITSQRNVTFPIANFLKRTNRTADKPGCDVRKYPMAVARQAPVPASAGARPRQTERQESCRHSTGVMIMALDRAA
jgi:hypothetical protein